MVKTTYALTLFTAAALAAPLPQGGGGHGNLIGAGTAGGAVNDFIGKKLLGSLIPRDNDAEQDGTHRNLISSLPIVGSLISRENAAEQAGTHRNLIDSIPIVGSLLGQGNKQQRDVQQRSFTDELSSLPILGKLLGGEQDHPKDADKAAAKGQDAKGHQARDFDDTSSGLPDFSELFGQNAHENKGQDAHQNAGQNEGQNAHQNKGENAGQNYGQNWAQNHKRDLSGELSGLPIVGEVLGGGDKKGSSEHQTRQLHGITSFIKQLTSGGPETISHRRRQLEALAKVATGAATTGLDESLKMASSIVPVRRDITENDAKPQASKQNQETKQDKANSPLSELTGKNGLGSLFGGAHHGLGLLPMNRRAAPIQGATLTDVLLNGGTLGKLSKILSPSPDAPQPGKAPAAANGKAPSGGEAPASQ